MKKILFYLLLTTPLLCMESINKFPTDMKSYFRSETMYGLLTCFAIGGAIANSPLDQKIHNFYQDNLRSNSTDTFLTFWKKMGQDEVIAVYSCLGAYSLAMKGSYTGDFTSTLFTKSARAFVIGTIPLHIMRTATGGSRPCNTTRDSYWQPLTLPHGVSGHTYTGAILFINWAKMVENPYLKTLLYGASTLTGISRMNDQCHYPSQVFLGWMMAYAACDAISYTDSKFNLSSGPNSIAFAFEF